MSNLFVAGIREHFAGVDTNHLPPFDLCRTTLEMSLWVLWVAKEGNVARKLTAGQIAYLLRDTKEVSIESQSVSKSLNRAGLRIHTHREDGELYYEIMKAGKGHLLSLEGSGSLQTFYFEPEKTYSSKRLLVGTILGNLTGELRIVDPYCAERTLDVIKDINDRPVRFLTRIDNLAEKARLRFLRELQDFKRENPRVELRSYPNADLHDRYIISPTHFVIIGHSIKDLGAKESFAVVLTRTGNQNVHEALSESFDRRWKQSVGL